MNKFRLAVSGILGRQQYYLARRKPVSIDPQQITISLDELDPRSVFIFIDEILLRGLSVEQTSLYRMALAGYNIRRRIGREGELLQLVRYEDFESYYKRCLLLAESIAKHGVLDIDRAPADLMTRNEKNVRILIREDGALYHYRRGKHRLAIARALGISMMPVDIYCNSLAGWRACRRLTTQ